MQTQSGAVDTPTTLDERLMRIDEVLTRIRVSKAHWYRAIARGEAPRPIHLGRTSLWRASDVSAWIASLGASEQ